VVGSPGRTADAAKAPPQVHVRDTWPYGAIYVLEHLWKEVGIDVELNRCSKKQHLKQPFKRALVAMVANRALSA